MKSFLLCLFLFLATTLATWGQQEPPQFTLQTFAIIDEFSTDPNLGSGNKTAIDEWAKAALGYTQNDLDEHRQEAIDHVYDTYGIPLSLYSGPGQDFIVAAYFEGYTPVAFMYRYNVTQRRRVGMYRVWGNSVNDYVVSHYDQYDFGYNIAIQQDWNDTEKGVFIKASQSIIHGRYDLVNDIGPFYGRRVTVKIHSRPEYIVGTQITRALQNGGWYGYAYVDKYGLSGKRCVVYGSTDESEPIIVGNVTYYHHRTSQDLRCPEVPDEFA